MFDDAVDNSLRRHDPTSSAMGASGYQSYNNSVVDYRVLDGSMDQPPLPAWDPRSDHGNLALQPNPLEVGRCIPAAVEYGRDWQSLAGEIDGVSFDLFQSTVLSHEELSAGGTVFFDDIFIHQSQTMPSSSYTVGSPVPCLASPSPSAVHTRRSIYDRPKTYPVFDKSFGIAAREEAQEDRRQRNTAASARFRNKKRLRGEALENSVKKEQIKIARLEAEIVQLEVENKWLRGLLTEKIDQNNEAKARSKENGDISDVWKYSGARKAIAN